MAGTTGGATGGVTMLQRISIASAITLEYYIKQRNTIFSLWEKFDNKPKRWQATDFYTSHTISHSHKTSSAKMNE